MMRLSDNTGREVAEETKEKERYTEREKNNDKGVHVYIYRYTCAAAPGIRGGLSGHCVPFST